jgi:hypothetical protein
MEKLARDLDAVLAVECWSALAGGRRQNAGFLTRQHIAIPISILKERPPHI